MKVPPPKHPKLDHFSLNVSIETEMIFGILHFKRPSHVEWRYDHQPEMST